MKNLLITIILIMAFGSITAQSRFSKHEISINVFRNPSIGLEYRYKQVSVHGGYYLTSFNGVTTNFIKSGLTFWFLPIGKKENPSSFYAGASYLRGLNKDYKDKDALGIEAGFRWMIWKGLNLRVGAIALSASNESLKLNPTGGISYSFFFN